MSKSALYYRTLIISVISMFLLEMVFYQETVRKIGWILILIMSILYLLISSHVSIPRRDVAIFVGIMLVSLVSSVYSIVSGNMSFNLHVAVMYIFGMYYFYSVPKSFTMDEKELKKFCSVFVFLVVLCCVFNYIKNYEILKSGMFLYHSANKSVFRNLSTYAWILSIGLAVCLYFIAKNVKMRKLFIAISLLFGVSIFLTGARSAMITSCISILYMMHMNQNMRKYFGRTVFLLIFLMAVYLIINKETVSYYMDYIYSFATHNGNTGFFKSDDRQFMWSLVFKSTTFMSFLFGNGFGSAAKFLASKEYAFGSFHSTFVDVFFEGGVAWAILYCLPFIDVLRKLKKSELGKPEKNFLFALSINIFISELFDSFGMIFGFSPYSFLASLMVISIPIMLVNNSSLQIHR